MATERPVERALVRVRRAVRELDVVGDRRGSLRGDRVDDACVGGACAGHAGSCSDVSCRRSRRRRRPAEEAGHRAPRIGRPRSVARTGSGSRSRRRAGRARSSRLRPRAGRLPAQTPGAAASPRPKHLAAGRRGQGGAAPRGPAPAGYWAGIAPIPSPNGPFQRVPPQNPLPEVAVHAVPEDVLLTRRAPGRGRRPAEPSGPIPSPYGPFQRGTAPESLPQIAVRALPEHVLLAVRVNRHGGRGAKRGPCPARTRRSSGCRPRSPPTGCRRCLARRRSCSPFGCAPAVGAEPSGPMPREYGPLHPRPAQTASHRLLSVPFQKTSTSFPQVVAVGAEPSGPMPIRTGPVHRLFDQ